MLQNDSNQIWRLPLETCEGIIEYVAEDIAQYTRTLHSCALVCRSWVPRSRFFLFQRVHLDNNTKATRFMSSICTCPDLGLLVRKLILDLRQRHEEWIYKLLRILHPLLLNLRELVYQELPILHPLFYVLSARFTVIEAIALVRQESLSFREIVRLLKGHTNLQVLRIIDCGWKSPGPFYPCQSSKLRDIHVERLSHPDCGGDILCWALAALDTPNPPTLRYLTCTGNVLLSVPDQIHLFNEFLRKHSKTLKTLGLTIAVNQLMPLNFTTLCEHVVILRPSHALKYVAQFIPSQPSLPLRHAMPSRTWQLISPVTPSLSSGTSNPSLIPSPPTLSVTPP